MHCLGTHTRLVRYIGARSKLQPIVRLRTEEYCEVGCDHYGDCRGECVSAQVPRRALLVLALCMEAGRFGLLLPLLSEEAGSPSLVQRLVILVDAATQNPKGTYERAATWQSKVWAQTQSFALCSWG